MWSAITVGVLLVGWAYVSGYNNRTYLVDVRENAALFETEEGAAYGASLGTAPLTTLEPGDRLYLKTFRYGKDYHAAKVRTEDGTTGWVLVGGRIELTRK
jgi:hypothetical protein